MTSCGYQGVPGAYSEAAAIDVFRAAKMDVKPIGFNTFEDVFHALKNGDVHYAALPFENTLGGSIHINYDLLLRYHGCVHILGEHSLRVRHTLLALPGVKIGQIKKAMSHPQALSQAEGYLRSHKIKPVAAYDTAGSAQLVQEQQLRDTAAVASVHAAEVHGLEVLDYGIEDDPNNYTRFLILGRSPATPPRSVRAKTSVVFMPNKNEAGALFKALSVFAVRDIDLSKIESRPQRAGALGAAAEEASSSTAIDDPPPPSKRARVSAAAAAAAAGAPAEGSDDGERSTALSSGANFQYTFYADLLASSTHERTQNALRHLLEQCSTVRVLGCYPVDGVMLDAASTGAAAGPAEDGSSSVTTVSTKVGSTRLRIALVGFGTFGQFLAQRWAQRGHSIIAQSRTDYSVTAARMGVAFVRSAAELIAHEPDAVVLCVSILSFEKVLKSLPRKLLEKALIVDVLSVKVHAKKVMLSELPSSADILCTHPMFGPDSGRNGWHGLPCVFDYVRVTDYHRGARVLSLFEDEGCQMVKMSCEQHDELAANSQFVTHLTGRLLAKLKLAPSPIATKGFRALLKLVDNTCRDSFDLFYALYSHNPNSSELLHHFSTAFSSLQSELLEYDGAAVGDAHQISRAVRSMAESKTVAVSDLAIELKRQGKPLISLSVGEPDFAPPAEVIAAAHEALDTGKLKYTALSGTHELRAAICADLKERKGVVYEPGEIVCTNGAKQALLEALMATCDPGDEVIVPAPFWPSHLGIPQLIGATPVLVVTHPQDGYVLQAAALEAAITPSTRMIILCNPSNPTGAVVPRAELEAIADVVRRHPRVIVLADEIYEAISYAEPVTAFASLAGMRERTITVNGFSKNASMTGFRLGYLAAPLPIAKACSKVQGSNTSCPSSISQHAGIAALKHAVGPFAAKATENFRQKRDFVLSRLRAMSGVECPTPQGAFYAFPTVSAHFGRTSPEGVSVHDSTSFCEYLLRECNLAVVPGDAFGAPACVRLSYATDMGALEEAMNRMERGINALKGGK